MVIINLFVFIQRHRTLFTTNALSRVTIDRARKVRETPYSDTVCPSFFPGYLLGPACPLPLGITVLKARSVSKCSAFNLLCWYLRVITLRVHPALTFLELVLDKFSLKNYPALAIPLLQQPVVFSSWHASRVKGFPVAG